MFSSAFLKVASPPPHLRTQVPLRTGRRSRPPRSISRTPRRACSAHTHTSHTHTLRDHCSPRQTRLACSSGWDLRSSPSRVRCPSVVPDWGRLAARCTPTGPRHCSASSARSCSDTSNGSGPPWTHCSQRGGPSPSHLHLHHRWDKSAGR